MAKTICLGDEKTEKQFKSFLGRAYQSSHINLLIGSGASLPAIKAAGNIEQLIGRLYKQRKMDAADLHKYKFIRRIQDPTNELLMNKPNSDISKTLQNYVMFLESIASLLHERRSSLIPKRANVFTSNYDLFIEKAGESVHHVILNDGFNRSPKLSMRYKFSPEYFFNSTFNTGNLYNYSAEVPSINLIKIHGSLSWDNHADAQNTQGNDDDIVFCPKVVPNKGDKPSSEKIMEYLEKFALVLPEMSKFEKTVIDRYHYDLLRIYANALELENSLLIVFGFSFEDEHILEITKRALRNSSLTILVFAYDIKSRGKFERKFSGFSNVKIVAPTGHDTIEFDKLIEFLCVRPKRAGDK